MRCYKLLGERVMARDFDRQVAELQVRAAMLNRFTRLAHLRRWPCRKSAWVLGCCALSLFVQQSLIQSEYYCLS
jgi:hypothetical protein